MTYFQSTNFSFCSIKANLLNPSKNADVTMKKHYIILYEQLKEKTKKIFKRWSCN